MAVIRLADFVLRVDNIDAAWPISGPSPEPLGNRGENAYQRRRQTSGEVSSDVQALHVSGFLMTIPCGSAEEQQDILAAIYQGIKGTSQPLGG